MRSRGRPTKAEALAIHAHGARSPRDKAGPMVDPAPPDELTKAPFKPMVRIVKNMRNSMIDADYIQEGLAPSYFIEGMLYNVPNGNFGSSYGDTFAAAINWLLKADRSKLLCANEQYYLLNPTSPVTWRAEDCNAFLDAVVRFWNEW